MVVQSKCGPISPHILFVFAYSYFDHLMWEADSLEKILMLGKIEGRRRRGQKMRWLMRCYHQLNGHEFEQTLGDGEGQSLSCYTQWGHKELDTTEWLNITKSYLSSDSKWPNSVIKTNYNHCSNSEENFLNSLTFIYFHEYTGKCFCPYSMGTHVTFQPEAFCFPLISQGTSWSGPNPLVMHCLSSFNCSIPFHSFLVEAVFQLILKLMLFTLSFFSY